MPERGAIGFPAIIPALHGVSTTVRLARVVTVAAGCLSRLAFCLLVEEQKLVPCSCGRFCRWRLVQHP
ncbi:MAG: hypothetical protein BJ554DRAFT_2339 [Olpidium bornovanus]|uniref:Uncharacterized protein n=1 Tax=Olpidium bornovanus TaxID=278681 RepID=A0A8H7ZQZ6_9FUNG|nr:MAG: hypothetical protein BJ554DRAFT_2339 [Olpidium bornovanus]